MSFDKTKHRRFGRLLLAGGFAIGSVSIIGTGCGGDDASITSGDGGTDGGFGNEGGGLDGTTPLDTGAMDTSTQDTSMAMDSSSNDGSMTTDGADGGGSSDAADASTACTGTETACTAASVPAGLCVASVCTPCNDPSDDNNCSTAYAGAYICDTAGSCVPGNCHTDANCTTVVGQICGITTPNTCGACTTDAQCQTDPNYGPSTICSPANGGTCVPSAGCTLDTQCANPADFCCGGTTACVPGNCCTNTQCTVATSPICGATSPNVCGPCTLDSQCAAPTPVCDTTGMGGTTGECVATTGQCSGTPGATGGDPGVCAPSSNDMCCAAQPCIANPVAGSTTAFPCCPGTGGNSYCQTKLSNTSALCSGNVCTACLAVSLTTPVYLVDPVNGSDSGTGSGEGADAAAVASCALKTITRAIQLINVADPTGAVATSIVVVGGAGVTVGAGETFPIPIPKNVTVTSSTGPVKVQVPSGKSGFEIIRTAAALTSGTGALITITTTVTPNSGTVLPTGGTNGILVADGSDATSMISNVTVSGMLGDGIHVQGGIITIGEGVVSTLNGIQPATRNGYQSPGLHVTNNGDAIITVPAGSTPTQFNSNTAHGILVDETGVIDLTGVPGATLGTGTIQTNFNLPAGVWIQQTPGSVVTRQNVITGLVSYQNSGGNGLRIVAGSSVQVRGSSFLANSGDGVIISTYTNGGVTSNDISHINLGTTGNTSGANTFQAVLGSGNNGNAGICLAVAANSGALNAVGNIFRGTNCATTAATLLLNATGCGNNAAQCTGGVCDLGFGSAAQATGNSFDVSMCTQ